MTVRMQGGGTTVLAGSSPVYSVFPMTSGRIPYINSDGLLSTLDTASVAVIYNDITFTPTGTSKTLRGNSAGWFDPGNGSTQIGLSGNKFAQIAATKAILDSSSRREINSVDGTVQTGAGASGIAATTAALTDNAVTSVEARVTGGKSDESEGCGYIISACYRRAGAGPVICGAVTAVATNETDATANATLIITGNTIQVQVTSPAGDTYDWNATVDVHTRV